MPRVIAYEEAKAYRYARRGSFRTPFLNPSRDTPELPVAFFVEGGPNRVTKPHWHLVDQFQVVVDGNGTFGRHEVAPYAVHFSRAYTPYGPLLGGSKTGMSTFTLFPHFEEGAQYFPESAGKLNQISNRRPWQITRQIKFFSQGAGAAVDTVSLQEVPDMKDDYGLFAYSLTMAPNTRTTAPDPSRGDGQYLLVVKGSLWHENIERKALTLVYVEPKEQAFEVISGAQGLEAIIMNFPRAAAHGAPKTAQNTASGLKRWRCELCAFEYDEALGLPDDGIPAGTRWEDVPTTWTCPDCSTSKSDFQMIEVERLES